ncbi:MAG: RNA-binding protein [Cytophagales bacterium]|nr:MAG: RNA-binding protein [Cytophagales bacterium]
MKHTHLSVFVTVLFSLSGCGEKEATQTVAVEPALFTLLSAEKTGVDFQNIINEGPNTNVLMYEYFYNGGGVAVGDLNGDKLEDLYFTANMSENRLYLNKGQMRFEDISGPSGAAGRPGPWRTGVAMADVNGDGRLDIFVYHSGNLPPEKKTNELFINQGNNPQGIPTFIDQTAEYGLDSPTSSTNAYFFDYDRDGDLDLFLLNHNIKSLPVLNEANSAEYTKRDDKISGCRLYKNTTPKAREGASSTTGGRFVDITTQSGINSSPLSYGLGAGIADFNQDGWPDIYVSNDYTIPDRLYINQKNGSFKDQLKDVLPYTSHFSMGNDVADVNNDAAPDIFTLDMLPEDNRRQKLLMAPDNYDKFDMTVRSGFHKQFMRNMLHLNPQFNLEGGFIEIAQLAGISNTDWSWSALFADYDNDGWKDLYITNGYLRDYTNLDFLKYMNDYQQSATNVTRQDVLNIVQQMPASNVVNYLFKNNKDLTFKNVGSGWGLGQNANSNGAVYADLDNDGDLDLVVNNINQPAFIYENESNKKQNNHYLKISLKGENQNTAGIGAKVAIYCQGKTQYLEQMPARGYQSSVSNTLHFGLGEAAVIDSLRVQWPSGKMQLLANQKTNQWLTIEEKNAVKYLYKTTYPPAIFEQSPAPINYQQPIVATNDFKRQTLMVNPQSQVGPCMAKADVNADGLEDVFVGGGNGQAGALFVQQKNGSFVKKSQPAFEATAQSHAADALFFDADADKDADLYVCHGGYGNFSSNDPRLQDVLYLNDGKGNFAKAPNALPIMPVSSSCVRVGDINSDGKLDLFVGGRVIPGQYPTSPKSYILVQTAAAQFKILKEWEAGMITDAAWVDLNADKKSELIVIGEWMPVTIFENVNGELEDRTDRYFNKKYSGYWNKLLVDDLNGDGKMDLVIGNLGLNSQIKASDTQPAELYAKDFDQNGQIDPILYFYVQAKSYPYVTRDELIGQMPMMGKRFPDYKSYADATLKDIFDASELSGATRLEANCLATMLFVQDASGKFVAQKLPIEVQTAPVHAILALDYDKDGKKDLLLTGNQLHTRLRFGHYAASSGILLHNDGKANFSYIPQQQSGFRLNGEVRSILLIKNEVLFGIYQQPLKSYVYRHSTVQK